MKPVYDHRKTYVIPRSLLACETAGAPYRVPHLGWTPSCLVLFAYVRIYAKMATLPDLDKALRGVAAEKLDKRCSRDDLDEISKSLTQWPGVSPYLGLTEADEEDVRAKSDRAVSGLTRERVNVLRRWQENQKESATYRWVEFEPHVPLKFIRIGGLC